MESECMIFFARNLTVAKDADYPDENQDASSFDNVTGRAAIADGVSSGAFSKLWAQTISQQFVTSGIDFDKTEFPEWLNEAREMWAAGIDWDKLNYFQKKKLKQTNGGYTTLFWIEIKQAQNDSETDTTSESEPSFQLQYFSVGDCNCFHVRNGKLIDYFTWTDPEDFGSRPASLGSTDLGHDNEVQIKTGERTCLADDCIILATDALAEYLVKEIVDDTGFDWTSFQKFTEPEFKEWVTQLRLSHQIERDDTTTVLIHVAAKSSGEDLSQDEDLTIQTEVSGQSTEEIFIQDVLLENSSERLDELFSTENVICRSSGEVFHDEESLLAAAAQDEEDKELIEQVKDDLEESHPCNKKMEPQSDPDEIE